MIARIWILFRIEVFKASRRRQPYLGPLLLIVFVLLSPLVRPLAQDGVQDYGFIAYVTPVALNFLGQVMLLAFASTLIVSETSRGSVRAVLLRPVRRGEFIAAKFLLAYGYAATLTITVASCAWVLAWAQGDLMGVHAGGELVFTSSQMWHSYAMGALLSLLPQCAGASMAVMFSTVSRSSSMAISLSLGTWIIADLAKYPLGVAPFVYTTYLEAPWQVFASQSDALDASWMPMVAWCSATSIAVIALSAYLSVAIFNRRNLGTC